MEDKSKNISSEFNDLRVETIAKCNESVKGLAILPSDDLLVASQCAIWTVGPTKTLKLYAGQPSMSTRVLGPRLQARFLALGAIRFLEFEDSENLFICDREGNWVLFVDKDEVKTFAGTGKMGRKDGPRLEASFDYPTDIVAFKDNLFITDYSNHLVRMIEPNGMVSTIGGGKSWEGTVEFFNAEFRNPFGLCATETDLYVSEHSGSRVRKIDLVAQTVSSWTGNGTDGYVDGPRETSIWDLVRGICGDQEGNVYACDCRNSLIRRISQTHVSTLFGNVDAVFSTDGDLHLATTQRPFFIIITPHGDLIWTEEHSNSVRTIRNFVPAKEIPSFPFLSFCQSLSSSSPLQSYMVNLSSLASSIVSIPIFLPLIQISIPHLNNKESIESFICDTPLPLQPALNDFFALLYGSSTIFSPPTTNHTAITMAHIIQILKRAKMEMESSLPIFLMYKFAKFIRFRPLEKLVSLLIETFCEPDGLVTEIIIERMNGFSESQLSESIHLLDPIKKTTPDVHRAMIARVLTQTSSFVLRIPKLNPFASLQNNLRILYEDTHINRTSPFKISIGDTNYEIYVHDWVLASQWSWFQAMMESGLSEVSNQSLELPSHFIPSLLEILLRFIYCNDIDLNGVDSKQLYEYIKENGGQFGITDLEGEPTPRFKQLIARIKDCRR
jgi:hypothetical protein